jgi:hypothetical protein
MERRSRWEGEELDRTHKEGLKVVLMPDPGEHVYGYGFVVFLKLDMVVGSELGTKRLM